MTVIETLHFDDHLDMAFAISNKYEELTNEDELDTIDIIAKYEDAKEILRRLITIGYSIACIDISDALANNYTDEYIISLYEREVWCEPAKRNNEYISVEDSGCVYLLDNCNSKIIHKIIDAKEVYEVEVGEVDDDCDCCCEHCDCCHDDSATCDIYVDEDDNVTGFSVHKDDKDSHMEFSYHSYGDEFLGEDVIRSILELFA